MNLNWDQAAELVDTLKKARKPSDVEVIIAPPALYLSGLRGGEGIHLSSQNVHWADSGAYTGEISASQLVSIGINYAIIGHSERRAMFHESDEMIANKVKALIEQGITPIFCCGESLEERESGNHFEVIKNQVEKGVLGLSQNDFSQCVIAYEPVWAIGTGKTASSEQAQEIHAFIRSLVAQTFDEATADSTSILYGGSCKPSNADELFACPDVDGGLIGGAALKAEDFLAIIEANSRL